LRAIGLGEVELDVLALADVAHAVEAERGKRGLIA
jgi:hypothetical protein